MLLTGRLFKKMAIGFSVVFKINGGVVMSERIKKNFEKRFGNPPRINVVYPDKPQSEYERLVRNKKIVSAVKEVLTGILGRKPTADELTGRKRIDEAKIQTRLVR